MKYLRTIRTYLAAFVAAFALMGAGSALAQCSGTLSVLDSGSVARTLAQQPISSVLYPCQTPAPLNGSGNPTPVSPSNPMPVVAGPTGYNVTVTPTVQNAAYASGNCIGGFQAFTLGTAASVLSTLTLASQGGDIVPKQVYIFSSNPAGSACTDKSTFTIATADLSKLITSFALTPSAPTGTSKALATASNLGIGVTSGGTMYVALVATAADTPATTTDLTLIVSGF